MITLERMDWRYTLIKYKEYPILAIDSYIGKKWDEGGLYLWSFGESYARLGIDTGDSKVKIIGVDES